jgi:hypothetical protein
MDDVLTLSEAAQRTGHTARRLGAWCATGLLRCERQDGSWLLPVSELGRVAELSVVRERATGHTRPAVLAVPAEVAPDDLADEVARRLGLPPDSVSISNVVIDRHEYTMAVWKDTDGAGNLPSLHALAEEMGGELLDRMALGEDAPG